MRSGLVLSGANRVWKGGETIEEMEDGILTAYEIVNMDLRNTDLVVLSACDTGLGEIHSSEGVFGLQRAFRLAGAKAIIMSLRKVDDNATVEFMQLFYKMYLKGKSKHEAFRKVQQKMKKRKYSPEVWAAFVLVE